MSDMEEGFVFGFVSGILIGCFLGWLMFAPKITHAFDTGILEKDGAYYSLTPLEGNE
ncbi:conserved hypothetical protein [Roseibium sp. TrichSKD4]|uniref:hypothetical protein n=1 Tax=Roseibium sp. TrichSKD4 TaxID=744980 RepID=UPI0001E56D2D|nr:hypothetical protein [Roseibium sp. TrichSKD4]EFO33238.1 conserved hypothetical protein [Roseibium sp. TrichSKD4]